MSFAAHSVPASPARPHRALVIALVGSAAFLILAISAFTSAPPVALLAPIAVGLTFAATHRWLLQWRTLTGILVIVILVIPIRRYTFPASLPFQLEPYRLLVAVLAVIWVGALLIEPRIRARRTGVEGALWLFALGILVSVGVNVARIDSGGLADNVAKQITFFASFFAVAYLITSVTVRRKDIDRLVAVLVGVGAIVGFFTLIESRTGFNVFDHLRFLLPGLDFTAQGDPSYLSISGDRGGLARAYGSSQHPIAMGAALMMLMPLGLYVAQRTSHRRWWVATAFLLAGGMATLSRTAIVMLVVEIVVLMRLRPEARRMWPAILPFVVFMHLVSPGSIGALKNAFFPSEGIVAQESAGAGTYGSGRIADLGPGLTEWSHKPLVGEGFATRIADRADPKVNAPILDDQWLNLLLETGLVGTVALLWLFVRVTRRMNALARAPGERSWLGAALAAGICSFAVGMLTFDAFSFIQVTLLLFVLIGIAGAEQHARTWRT